MPYMIYIHADKGCKKLKTMLTPDRPIPMLGSGANYQQLPARIVLDFFYEMSFTPGSGSFNTNQWHRGFSSNGVATPTNE